MLRFSHIIFVIFIAILGFSLFAVPTASAQPAWWPIVPCGLSQDYNHTPTNESLACNRCSIFELADRLIDFALVGLMIPVATLFFLYAGFKMLISQGKPGEVAAAQGIFWNVCQAVAIILASWLLTNTLIQSLGARYQTADSWFTFTCSTSGEVTPSPTSTATTSPTGTTTTTSPPTSSQIAAQALIGAIGEGSFSTNGDCGSANTARTAIQAIAAGNYPPVCSVSCDCRPGGASGNITVRPEVLNGLTALSQAGFGFTVTSLTTGVHSANSRHYSGGAVDIVPTSDNRQAIINFLRSRGGFVLDEGDHIHWQYP